MTLLCSAGSALAVDGSDIAVNQTLDPASSEGYAGANFQYVVEVGHNTGGQATQVILTDRLPLNARFVSASSADGITCSTLPAANALIDASNQEATCEVGTIAVGAKKTITFNVILPTSGNWANAASVQHEHSDPNTTNDSQSRSFTVYDAADMQLTVTATPDGSAGNLLTPGQPFTYNVDVTNAGPAAIPSGGRTVVRFDVPVGVSVTKAGSSNGWTCSPTNYPLTSPGGGQPNTTVTCTHPGEVASGQSLVVEAIPNTTNSITAIFNVKGYPGAGDAEMPDGQPDNNTQPATVTPSGNGADMSLTKTRTSSASAGVGDNAVFRLRPRFNGGVLAGPNAVITVTDTLGTGLSFVSATGTGWTCNPVGQVITCTTTLATGMAAPGNLNDITVTARVDAQGTLNNVGVIAPGSTAPDPEGGNNTAQASVTGTTTADLEVWKSSSTYQNGVNQAVKVGDEFNFYIGVRNHGPLSVPVPVAGTHPTITVTDNIPVGVTALGLTAGTSTDWSCPGAFPMVGPATLTCTYSKALSNGASTPDIGLRAVRTTEGIATNTACVSFQDGTSRVDPTSPPTAWNNCDGVGVGAHNPGDPLTDEADLQVTKLASGTVFVGETLTYTIRVFNAGPATAKNVQMRDVLTNLYSTSGGNTALHGLQGVKIDAPATMTCTLDGTALALNTTRHVTGAGSGSPLVCDLGDIPSQAARVITVAVRPMIDKTGARTNTAWAYAQETVDPSLPNNTGNTTSTVTARVDLRADKSGSPTPAKAGQPIAYTAAVINDGPSSAQNVWLKDTLPADVELVGSLAPSSNGTCTLTAGVIDCVWNTAGTNEYLASGGRYEVNYTLRSTKNQDPFSTRTLVNAVEVGTVTDEPNKANNTATASVVLRDPELDLVVNMNDGPDLIDLGTETTYTIRVTNSGPSYGTNVTLVDTFPSTSETNAASSATFSYEGGLGLNDPSKGTCTGPAVGATSGSVQCSFPLLAPGETIIVTYKMKAQSLPAGAPSGTIFHKAVITLAEKENRSGVNVDENNTTHEGTTTRRAAPAAGSEIDLGIEKTTGSERALPGTEFDYVLKVTNHSPTGRDVTSAHGAQVLDTLPAGLTFVSASNCAYDANTRRVSCAVTSLAGDGGATSFTLRVRLDSPYAGTSPLSNTACVDMPGDPMSSNNCSTAPKEVGSPPPPASIPTLSEWGLIILSILLAAFALRRMPLQPGRRS